MSTGLRSGILLALLGAFLIMRTITQDHTGRTLIDRLLGHSGSAGNVTPAEQAAVDAQGAALNAANPAAAADQRHRAQTNSSWLAASLMPLPAHAAPGLNLNQGTIAPPHGGPR